MCEEYWASLLSRCTAWGVSEAGEVGALASLSSHLRRGEVASLFSLSLRGAREPESPLSPLLSQLVKLPDRSINMLACSRREWEPAVPSSLYPSLYVPLLLRSLCLCLHSMDRLELQAVQARLASSQAAAFLSLLVRTFSEDARQSSPHFFTFLGAWASSSPQASAFCGSLFSSLEPECLRWAVLSSLRAQLESSERLFSLLRGCLVREENFLLVLELCLRKPLPGGVRGARLIVGYLATASRERLGELVRRALFLWGDMVTVGESRLEQLQQLATLLCLGVRELEQGERGGTRGRVLPPISRGMGVWLDQGEAGRRGLGMSSAAIMLQLVGETPPQWELDTQPEASFWLQQLRGVLGEGEGGSVGGLSCQEILQKWDPMERDNDSKVPGETPSVLAEPESESAPVSPSPSLDSDDDCDPWDSLGSTMRS